MFHLIRAGATYEIWTVRPLAENTAYAMKWLPRGDNYTRELINSLRHEYQVATSLDHENIIKCYEFGTAKEGAFLVMDLFRVPNLKQRIHTSLVQLQPSVEKIIRQAAASLAHLHERGWVHRDVKPDNFLVGDDHFLKLIDFNLTQKLQGKLSRIFSGKSKIQGTQSYISPEQIRGKPCDARTDIYSLGCVIFEIINGKPPFTASSSNELLTKHLRTRPPSLLVVNKDIEPKFAELVQKMMAKRPEDRLQSLEELLTAMDQIRVYRRPPKETPRALESNPAQ